MLATLHKSGAPHFGHPPAPYGEGRESLGIGPLEFPDEPSDDWATFYAERRLLPLLPRAGLSASGNQAVEQVCERMAELAGPAEPPARLHGDLWSGNVLASGGRPYLIDPAAYGGHREVDLAMLQLFGAPSPATLAAYDEVHPRADGHEERVALYQLFPLLVHAALFGGGYPGSARARRSTRDRNGSPARARRPGSAARCSSRNPRSTCRRGPRAATSARAPRPRRRAPRRGASRRRAARRASRATPSGCGTTPGACPPRPSRR
jgi:hypothetical protein